jgi:hypothetical protein
MTNMIILTLTLSLSVTYRATEACSAGFSMISQGQEVLVSAIQFNSRAIVPYPIVLHLEVRGLNITTCDGSDC